MIQTEFIIFGTPKNVGKVVEWTVDVGDAIIIPSGSVRNIKAIKGSYMSRVRTQFSFFN